MNREFYKLKFRMEAEKGDTAEIMVYSEIASEKLWGDETTTGDFDKAVKEAAKNGVRKLNLRINSGGGEVYAAVAMRSMIMNAGFQEVRVMIEGLCASAATLFATIPGAHVVIAAGSEFMIHNPMTIAWGNANDIQKEVDHLHSLEEQFHDMYAMKTGESREQIKAWMDETKWFKASEAVEHHFCDELLDAEPVAACVSGHEMSVMKAMYAKVPEEVRVRDIGAGNPVPGRGNRLSIPERDVPAPADSAEAAEVIPVRKDGQSQAAENKDTAAADGTPSAFSDRTENPVAGFSSVNKNKEETQPMEIKDITRDQLLAENPALAEEIRNSAIQAERERMEEIDALCVPGYEAMAEEAKKNGTSAVDFQKSIVKAMKEKGNTFMTQRAQETAPAANVAGGSASDTAKTEEEELKAFTEEIKGYVAQSDNKSMF